MINQESANEGQRDGQRRRKARRIATCLQSSVADIMGTVLSSATIANISETGACFTVPAEHEGKIPEKFVLYLTPDGKARRYCQTVWHRGTVFGVSFLKPKLAAAPPAPATAVKIEKSA